MTTSLRPAALMGLAALCACASATTSSTSTTADARAGVPPGDTVALGRAIFFDERLSANGNQSCATCHAPAWGWTGPDSALNVGSAVYEGSVPGRFGDRKPPSSAYATASPVFHRDGDRFVGGSFWDGRATGERLGSPAVEQALGPFLNPVEHGLVAPADVVRRICDGPYADAFRAVAGASACRPEQAAAAFDVVGRAIAAFEASPESNAFTSKYDLVLQGRAQLTPQEHQGMRLFHTRGRCASCHEMGAAHGRGHGHGMRRGMGPGAMHQPGALFTDFSYDNLGLPRNPANPQGADHTDRGLRAFLLTRADYAAYADANDGKHKVPTLRNVGRRPTPTSVKAYGHNGYFKSLEGIVHFYNTRDALPRCPGAFTEAQALAAGCWPAPEVEATMNRTELGNLGLSAAEEAAIVAFLRTLSDGWTP